MGRHRKPADLAELDGSADKNPQRYRDSGTVPKPSGDIGKPPSYMDKEQRKCWKEIADNAHIGLLANTDRHLLEQAALILAEQRACILWNRDLPKLVAEANREVARRKAQYGSNEAVDEAVAAGELEPIDWMALRPRGIPVGEKQLYVSLLSRMGMSPVDRNKVALPTTPEEGDTDDGFGEL